MRFEVRGAAFFQVWLLVFGFVGVVEMMGVVSGNQDFSSTPVLSGGSEGLFKTSSGGYWYRASDGRYTTGQGDYAEFVKGGDGKVTLQNTKLGGDGADGVAEFKDGGGGNGGGGGGGVTGCTGADCEQGALSENLGLEAGGFGSALANGLEWAAYAYLGGKMLGGVMGLNEKNSEALANAMAAGFGSYRMLSTWSTTSGSWVSSGWVGFAIGAYVFLTTYKEASSETVEFTCMPWQAPSGGNNCEECNDDSLPCTEYRCKSLGQSCEIANEGSVEEKCVYVNPRDTNPPTISPNYNELTSGHEYDNVRNSPPGP
ncbi:MAG: hypothetical protein MI922_15440, partial [Bacteroidales bacterium]|nr:hypothetical protein [Bacteroidales bacterium]